MIGKKYRRVPDGAQDGGLSLKVPTVLHLLTHVVTQMFVLSEFVKMYDSVSFSFSVCIFPSETRSMSMCMRASSLSSV